MKTEAEIVEDPVRDRRSYGKRGDGRARSSPKHPPTKAIAGLPDALQATLHDRLI